MPSLARVIPVISLIINCFLPSLTRAFSSEVDTGSREENASKQEIQSFGSDSIGTDIALVARRAVLGVAVAVILEHLLYDLGLEFTVGALGDLGQIEVLDRIAVDAEFEVAA